ncbi:MAG: zinc ribbon domain-containing protein, partial [Waterburya sp.]
CPRCQTLTGKKLLSERVHSCSNCDYTTDRDVAAAQVVMQRGLNSVSGNASFSPAYSICEAVSVIDAHFSSGGGAHRPSL